MITLIISKGEFIAAFIFFTLIVIYGLSSFMLAKHRELSLKVQKMSDAELMERYHLIQKDNEQNPTYWKKQELAYFREEIEKRKMER